MRFDEFKYKMQFILLGKFIEVRSTSENILTKISDYFSVNDNSVYTSIPDVTIFINAERVNRYFFRSRPKNVSLPEIYWQTKEHDNPKLWKFHTPPLPPFELFPDQYTAIHAAAISNASRQVFLISGPRGAGKTTAALRAVNKFGFNFLTDETAIVQTGTDFVYSFPRLILKRKSSEISETKLAYRADSYVNSMNFSGGILKGNFFINPADNNKIVQLNGSNTLKLLLEGYQFVGTPLKRAAATLMELSLRPSFLVNYKKDQFSDLNSMIDRVISIATNL